MVKHATTGRGAIQCPPFARRTLVDVVAGGMTCLTPKTQSLWRSADRIRLIREVTATPSGVSGVAVGLLCGWVGIERAGRRRGNFIGRSFEGYANSVAGLPY